MPSKRVLIGVGVGALALGSAAAAGLYYLYSIKADYDHQGHFFHETSQAVIEVEIPEEMVSVVIGKGGRNIKEMQRITNTTIDVKSSFSDSSRIIVIRGRNDNASLAEILINQTMASQPSVLSHAMFVPPKSIGRLIGKNGQVINAIQRQSHCKIRVLPGQTGEVVLRGSAKEIEAAKTMIECQLRSNYGFGKGLPPLSLTAENPDSPLIRPTGPQVATHGGRPESLMTASLSDFIEVYVSCVINPGHFYVQNGGPSSVALDKLVEEMTTFYDSDQGAAHLHDDVKKLKTGDLVAAKFSGDNMWYRGRVSKVRIDEYDESRSMVDIFFVDYGDCQRKALDQVAQLKSEFLQLNFQAISCGLAGIKPARDNEWSEKAVDDFEKLTHVALWTKLLARRTIEQNCEERTLIELVDANSSQEDVNIAAELVKRGHALFLMPDAATSTPTK